MPDTSANSPSVPVEASPAQAISPAEQPLQPQAESLSQLDEAMAAELDHVLQGNFESIDTVLEGVFEEKAAFVQHADGSPAIENPTQQAIYAAPETFEPPAAARTDSIETAATPTVAATPPEPIVPPVVATPPLAQVEPAPVLSVPSAAPAEPIKPAVPMEQPAVHDDPEPMRASVRAKGQGLHASQAIQRVLSALALINAPIRMVPAKFLPIVNWAALTLLAWVPVVWLMVLLTRGHGHAAANSSGRDASVEQTAAPEPEQPAIHTESAVTEH